MEITKAKWFNNACSPVVLMIDDLNNLWFDFNKRGHPGKGEDWGYWRDEPSSAFSFLKANFIDIFPETKVTFFTVVGNPIICNYIYGRVYSGRINENPESAQFFNDLHHAPNFEIAYHGLTHGVVRNGKYMHEWDSFRSLEEALRNIEIGQDICYSAFGEKLNGGKYPGYTSNTYSDESIDKSAFLWWCRNWTYGEFLAGERDYSLLEMKTFGKNDVVDFPSTVNPSICCKNTLIKVARRLVRNPEYLLRKYMISLLNNRQVISIQEHSGAVKANGIRQAPNIIDDIRTIKNIYSFLRSQDVWHATCSDISNYYLAFTHTDIEIVEDGSFKLRYTGRPVKPWLTLLFEGIDFVQIISPTGKIYLNKTYPKMAKYELVNIEVENGYYQIKRIR